VRSTLAQHLVDVETSDRHTVKPWFNGKVDFAPPVFDLADAGFPLVGGRLDYLDDRVVAALVYRRNKHVVNLFVWPAKPDVLPARNVAPPAGYSIVHWAAGGLQFWAVSDVEPRDLEAFHQAFAKAAHS
jgi:anti-sigma factor RsiW